LLVYVFANRDKVLEDNWIFYPELEFSFNRLSEQKNFSSEMGPKGKTCVCAEITYDPNKELWNASDDVVVQRVVADLEKADVLTEEEIYDSLVVRLKNIYPKYDVRFMEKLNVVFEYLEGLTGVLTLGRQGLFNYNNTDNCLDMGQRTAEFIKSHGSKQDWKDLLKYFYSYRIVD
ncbi:MAG TPA: hypothetical protein VJA40_04380, partial [archaeon]|nr:hypothetical protein [archaeon]